MVRTLRPAPSLVIARWSAQTGTRHWCHPDVRPRRQARCRLLPIPLRRMRLVSPRTLLRWQPSSSPDAGPTRTDDPADHQSHRRSGPRCSAILAIDFAHVDTVFLAASTSLS